MDNIALVEFEITSYCNRKCKWCPNSFIDRTHTPIEFDEEVYLKVLNEIKDLTLTISFTRFCEPMSNIELLKKRVKQARKIVSNGILLCNTNGDYIDKNSFKDLYLDKLSIMDYDCKGRDYWINLLTECGIHDIDEYGDRITGIINNIEVRCLLDWTDGKILEDRAGLLKSDFNNREFELRQEPCYVPKRYIAIAYTGEVTPCCHYRFDAPEHKDYILGNVRDNTVEEIYYSDKAVNFRKRVEHGNLPDGCKRCTKQ